MHLLVIASPPKLLDIETLQVHRSHDVDVTRKYFESKSKIEKRVYAMVYHRLQSSYY